MKKTLVLVLALFGTNYIDAQVGINTSNPDPSAALDIQSTTGGLLIPRLTEAQKNAIASPADGLMIYQNNQTSGFYYYDGNNWKLLSSDIAQPSTDYNDQIRYTISGGIGNIHTIDIVSSSTIFYNNDYSVNGDVVQINDPGHGLQEGDYVYTFGLGLSNNYHEVKSIVSNDYFEINSDEFVSESGNNFTYTHAVEMKDIVFSNGIGAFILSIPTLSDLIIDSIRVYYDSNQTGTMDITLPYNISTEDYIDLPYVKGKSMAGGLNAGNISAYINFNQSTPNKISVSGIDNGTPILLKIFLW